MNRTVKDFLGLFLAMWVVFFISNLTNPNVKNKNQITAGFIGVAYCIGRRPDKKAPKVQTPKQPRPPIQFGGK